MTALIIGAVLAVGALAYVLLPLFLRPPREALHAPGEPPSRPSSVQSAETLREVDLDRASGKLAADDYAALEADLTAPAPASHRVEERTAPTDDALEAMIRHYRSRPLTCSVCGPRPEPDAAFCSTCGRPLPAA